MSSRGRRLSIKSSGGSSFPNGQQGYQMANFVPQEGGALGHQQSLTLSDLFATYQQVHVNTADIGHLNQRIYENDFVVRNLYAMAEENGAAIEEICNRVESGESAMSVVKQSLSHIHQLSCEESAITQKRFEAVNTNHKDLAARILTIVKKMAEEGKSSDMELSKAVGNVNNLIVDMSAKVADLKEQQDLADEDASKKWSENTADLEDTKSRIAGAATAYAALEQKSRDQEQIIAALSAKLTEQQRVINSNTADISGAGDCYTKLEKVVGQKHNALEERIKEAEDVSKKVAKNTATNATMVVNIQSDLQQQQQTMFEMGEHLKKQRNDIGRDILSATNELQSRHAESQRAQQHQIDELNRKITEQRLEAEGLQSVLNSLRSNSSASAQRLSLDAKNSLDDANTNIAHLTAQLEALRVATISRGSVARHEEDIRREIMQRQDSFERSVSDRLTAVENGVASLLQYLKDNNQRIDTSPDPQHQQRHQQPIVNNFTGYQSSNVLPNPTNNMNGGGYSRNFVTEPAPNQPRQQNSSQSHANALGMSLAEYSLFQQNNFSALMFKQWIDTISLNETPCMLFDPATTQILATMPNLNFAVKENDPTSTKYLRWIADFAQLYQEETKKGNDEARSKAMEKRLLAEKSRLTITQGMHQKGIAEPSAINTAIVYMSLNQQSKTAADEAARFISRAMHASEPSPFDAFVKEVAGTAACTSKGTRMQIKTQNPLN